MEMDLDGILGIEVGEHLLHELFHAEGTSL